MVTIRIGDVEEQLTWEQWEQRVRAGRIPPTTLVRFEPVTGQEFRPAEELDLFHSMSEASRREWADRYRSGPPPWMTALLAGAQIQLWWLLWAGRTGGDPMVGPAMQRLSEALRLWNPSILEQGEVWRIITAGMFHEDWLHIGSNLVMFIYVGWHLERALGRLNLLTIFTVSVVGGSLASMFLSPSTPSIGASGGVLGVVAAATVFGFVRHGLLSDRARIIFGWALLPYLVLIYALGWSNEGTDNWAHTGGLLTGALLALVLDPPGMERRKGWNAGALALAWGSVALVLSGLWLGGSRLITTLEIPSRQPAASRSKHREVIWRAPVSWVRTNMYGTSGYASPADRARGFAVHVRNDTQPPVIQDQFDSVVTSIRSDWGDDVTVDDPVPATLAGREGQRIRVAVAGEDAVVVEQIVVTRGHQQLIATWSVDRDREAALAPLRDRLLASVEWDLPESLLRAQDAVDRKPANRALRRALADELLLVGQSDEAIATWRALIAERPDSPDGWLGLLGVARSNPAAIGDVEALCAEALEATDVTQVAAEVALTLSAVGEHDTARGLTELAWAYVPGDRHVRRARRRLGQPTRLRGIEPAQLRVDPITGARLEQPIREPSEPPWTLEQARAVGRDLAAARQTLAEQVRAESAGRVLGPLLMLRLGVIPDLGDLPDDAAGTIEDLRAARLGLPPPWMPQAVVAWADAQGAADPAFADALDKLATPPADDLGEADADEVDAWLEALGLRRSQGPDAQALERG